MITTLKTCVCSISQCDLNHTIIKKQDENEESIHQYENEIVKTRNRFIMLSGISKMLIRS